MRCSEPGMASWFAIVASRAPGGIRTVVKSPHREFKRSASREADRLVYRLTREKPPAGASWRGLRALAFVKRSQGSHRDGGQTAVSPPRSHGLSERVNSSLRSRGRSERGQGPGCGLSVARADFRARLPFGDGFPGARPGAAIELALHRLSLSALNWPLEIRSSTPAAACRSAEWSASLMCTRITPVHSVRGTCVTPFAAVEREWDFEILPQDTDACATGASASKGLRTRSTPRVDCSTTCV
jgi:hypothetical protein